MEKQQERPNEGVYLSRYYIGTSHSECIRMGDSRVLFVNEHAGIQKQLVEPNGTICDFPGVEYSKGLTAELGNREIAPVVKYEAAFKKQEDGTFLMEWTVRPDGRYWMDSWGFGAEDYDAVCLYAVIDSEGNFTAPFRLSRIGYTHFGPGEVEA